MTELNLDDGITPQLPEDRFYLVRRDSIPDALWKTLQCKELLARGEVKTVHEAVERTGLSRSAFYKYKDAIFPITTLVRERIVTMTMELEHRAGILSRVLAIIAEYEGNVLTINQTIPLQGMAHLVLSIDMSHLRTSRDELIAALQLKDGVKRVSIVAQG